MKCSYFNKSCKYNIFEDYEKVKRTINSCTNSKHWSACLRYIIAFEKKWEGYNDDLEHFLSGKLRNAWRELY